MAVICLIPVFNNAATIGEVVRKCRTQGFPVVVVDDGSTDDSAEAARNAGATVVSFPRNRGKGAALIRGFSYVLREYPQIDLVVTLDADGQHDPADIPRLLDAVKDGNSFVIGSRTEDVHEMPLVRRVANQLVSSLISSFLGTSVIDTQSGFRVFPVRLLQEKKFSQLRYGIETEMLFAAAAAGLSIREVPIKAVYFRKAPISLRKDLVNLFDIMCIAAVKGLPLALRTKSAWSGWLLAATLALFFVWQFNVAMRPLERALEGGAQLFSKLTPGKDTKERLAVFEWLRQRTPPDAVIFAPRHEGHRIMALADRRAIVSSKVYPSESANVAARARDTARFFFATDNNQARLVLAKYGASYVLVPKSKDWFGLCRDIFACHFVNVSRNDAARQFSAGDLTPEGAQRTLVGRLLGGAEIPFLRKVWDSPSYAVYRLTDASEPAPCELDTGSRQAIADAVLGKPVADKAVLAKRCNIEISIWRDGMRRLDDSAKGLTIGAGIQKIMAGYLGDPSRIEAMEITISDPAFPEFSRENFLVIRGAVENPESEPWSDARLRERVRRALDWIASLQRPDGTFRNFIDPSNPDAPDPEPRDIALDSLGSWALAEGYAVFRDPAYLRGAHRGLAAVERRILQDGKPVRTNALSFALMARLRLWEATGDASHRQIASHHQALLRSLLTADYWIPERFISEDGNVQPAGGSEYTSVSTHIAFWALARWNAALGRHPDASLQGFAEELRHRFLVNHIVKRDLDLAETGRLANGFRAFAQASGDQAFLRAAREIGMWLAGWQKPDGSFPEHPQSVSLDTNSVGRVAEGLVFAGSDFQDEARRAFQWLMEMQYTPESLYFVPPKERASLVGGLAASPASRIAPIGAASHFVLSGLWYLERQ